MGDALQGPEEREPRDQGRDPSGVEYQQATDASRDQERGNDEEYAQDHAAKGSSTAACDTSWMMSSIIPKGPQRFSTGPVFHTRQSSPMRAS